MIYQNHTIETDGCMWEVGGAEIPVWAVVVYASAVKEAA